ncbi:MAG TPA: poly(3-hydroxyalkanoate) depolymerase [Streptosporangiaceae bacterium]|nr:poly(3-hydroxyalkanoate) depolymerase [Streptosporangiaceae bacterium]
MTADPAGRIQMLAVGGRVLRVATRDGNPGRPPLLLCNGIGGRLELFQPFVDALDPRRGVIRFDMPGIGGSPAPVVPYHLATLAPLLTRLLGRLGVARADVLGISWGGGLAQQFALSRPDRVRRLVLVATGPGALMVPGHPKVLLRMLTPRRHRDPGHAVRIAGELYGGSLRETPALARELLHAMARPDAARGYYYQLLSGVGWTSLPRLGRLRPPTLILAGDDDPIIPLVNAKIMHRLIPDSQLHVYHGGHLELGLGAGRLVPVVEAFLDARPAAAGSPIGQRPLSSAKRCGPPDPETRRARGLLLAEFRLQRVHALLEGFLVFLLLLLADRLARRLLGFLGGSLLRLEFREHLVERTAHDRAAQPGDERVQRLGRVLDRLGQERVPARRHQGAELLDRLVTGVEPVRVIQRPGGGAGTPAQQHPHRAAEHPDEHPDQGAARDADAGLRVTSLRHVQVAVLVPLHDGRRADLEPARGGRQLAQRLVRRAVLRKRDRHRVLRHKIISFPAGPGRRLSQGQLFSAS